MGMTSATVNTEVDDPALSAAWSGHEVIGSSAYDTATVTGVGVRTDGHHQLHVLDQRHVQRHWFRRRLRAHPRIAFVHRGEPRRRFIQLRGHIERRRQLRLVYKRLPVLHRPVSDHHDRHHGRRRADQQSVGRNRKTGVSAYDTAVVGGGVADSPRRGPSRTRSF